MRKQCLWLALAVSFTMFAAAPAPAADAYALDTAHAGVTFKISHVGISWTYGRFNELNGDFTIDTADPSKCSFTMNIKSASIDTGNQKRDEHLRSPDFFNVKQYPVITFKSTAVKPAKDGYEVTGDFTMHGVTKSITFPMTGGKTAEFPKGVQRTGFTADLVLKRADYGIDKFAGAVGDDIHISVSFEGTKK